MDNKIKKILQSVVSEGVKDYFDGDLPYISLRGFYPLNGTFPLRRNNDFVVYSGYVHAAKALKRKLAEKKREFKRITLRDLDFQRIREEEQEEFYWEEIGSLAHRDLMELVWEELAEIE